MQQIGAELSLDGLLNSKGSITRVPVGHLVDPQDLLPLHRAPPLGMIAWVIQVSFLASLLCRESPT